MRNPCMRPKMSSSQSDEFAVPLCYRCHTSEIRQADIHRASDKPAEKVPEVTKYYSEKTETLPDKAQPSQKVQYSEKGLPEPVTHPRRDTRTPYRVLAFVAIGTCAAWQTYSTMCK